MAGYIFAVARETWEDICNNNIKYGYFAPFAPTIDNEKINRPRARKAINKVLCAVFGDMITMQPGDNVYFLSQRKIYGIGHLVNIGGNCKYDNYLNASAMLPDCEITPEDVLTVGSSQARWVCFFEPAPHFFKKGVDMDDVLRYRPNAFKMLRAFEGVSFIKIDDDENRALKEYISLANEEAYEDIEGNVFEYSTDFRDSLLVRNLASHQMDINKVFTYEDNWGFVDSEMFIEAALLQALASNSCPAIGNWDHCTHQLIASPFKPLTYIDKIDIFGYRFSNHYTSTPKVITKYLLIELKHDAINGAALEQTMQYVDWVCAEYASGDYSRIEAFVVGTRAVRNIRDIISEKCQRDYIAETHPVVTKKWNALRLIQYSIDNGQVIFCNLT